MAVFPASVTVLDRWKGDDLTGANAAAVSSWPAAAGVAVAQPTGANQPTKRTNVLNGHTVARLDGTNDSLDGTLAAADAQPFTLYFLIKATVLGNVKRQILGGPGGGLELYINALTSTTGTRASWWGNAERTFGTVTQNTWELWTIVADTTASLFYVNGTSAYSGNSGSASLGPAVYLGRHLSAGNYFNGDIAEVVHCDGANDATQRTAVHTYFANEYALTIAGTAPPAGVAAGTLAFAGSASGKRAPKATAAGTLAYAGAATGKRAPKATSTGTLTYVSAAAGSRAPKASAAGTITTVGVATGAQTPKATATGVTVWVGAATGVAPVVPITTGTASGSLIWTGAAVGRQSPQGHADGSTAWIGTTVGAVVRQGTATSETVWVGLAVGTSRELRDLSLSAIVLDPRMSAAQVDTRFEAAVRPRRLTATLEA